MKTAYYAVTDIGLKRSNNEDYIIVNEELGLYLLADGMGGHLAGETASRLALTTACDFFLNNRNVNTERLNRLQRFPESLPEEGRKLVYSIIAANNAVTQAAKDKADLRGMGTTIVALKLGAEEAFISHVGDSRIYLMRNGLLRQMTEDHNMFNEEMKKGILSPEQLKDSPLRRRLVRALGHMDRAKVDIRGIRLKKNDLFLLCSDGLTDMLPDALMERVLLENFDNLPAAGSKLVEMAKGGGGIDNISIIILKIIDA